MPHYTSCSRPKSTLSANTRVGTHIWIGEHDGNESGDEGGSFGVVGWWEEGSVEEGEGSGEEEWDFEVWSEEGLSWGLELVCMSV